MISNVVPDPSERDYFLNWLSFTFSTRKKSIVAWLIRGTQGTGKNLMFEKIITPLWGKEQCTVVGNAELDSEFNSYLSHKMMIAFNEVTSDYRKDKKEKDAKLKQLITDELLQINEKYERKLRLENFANNFFFSNYDVPVIVPEDDRRYIVIENMDKLEVNPNYLKYKNHTEFLKAVQSELPTFAQFLINYNYDEIKANRVFLNEAKKNIIQSSMDMFELFAKKLIEKDNEWLRDESGVLLNRGWTLESVENRYILKDEALIVFNEIFGTNIKSQMLSQKLQYHKIEINKKKTIGNLRPRIYSW